jgi:hypothetical protein
LQRRCHPLLELPGAGADPRPHNRRRSRRERHARPCWRGRAVGRAEPASAHRAHDRRQRCERVTLARPPLRAKRAGDKGVHDRIAQGTLVRPAQRRGKHRRRELGGGVILRLIPDGVLDFLVGWGGRGAGGTSPVAGAGRGSRGRALRRSLQVAMAWTNWCARGLDWRAAVLPSRATPLTTTTRTLAPLRTWRYSSLSARHCPRSVSANIVWFRLSSSSNRRT